MATLLSLMTLRQSLSRILTNTELDNNFINIANSVDTLQSGTPGPFMIGTGIPSGAKLEVISAGGNGARLRSTSINAGSGSYLFFNNFNNSGTSADVAWISTSLVNGIAGSEAADLLFGSSTSGGVSERMRITSGGAVLIGKTTATTGAKLEVSGSASFSAGFGCNGKNPQTAVTAAANATDLATAIALVNQLKTTLINNGIMA